MEFGFFATKERGHEDEEIGTQMMRMEQICADFLRIRIGRGGKRKRTDVGGFFLDTKMKRLERG